MLVIAVANALAPFLSHGVRTIPMPHGEVEFLVLVQMPDRGDEGVFERPLFIPAGKELEDTTFSLKGELGWRKIAVSAMMGFDSSERRRGRR